MDNNKKYIDMHIHSKYSDGYFDVKEIVDMANQNEICFMAISDHDSIKSLAELQLEIPEGVYGTSAIEISTYMMLNQEKIKLHLLGYGFDSGNCELEKVLLELKKRRMYFHKKFLEKLKSSFNNLPIEEIDKLDIERYCWFDRDILACLKSCIKSSQELENYLTFFKKNKMRYGIDYPIEISTAIAAINAAGGISVLAHPMAYNLSYEKVQIIIKQLIDMGLQGIEVYQSDCSSYDSIRLLEEVNKYNLLYSVGSDFHRIINSDGREICKGINNNLCVSSTSLTDYLIEKKLVFTKKKK